ncbi:MAG: yegM [Chitinophagaceae bacterium]|nr:yegM [Chitinophagaceae bacterium]
MKRYIIAGIILLFLIVIKLQFFSSAKGKDARADKKKEKPPVPVSVFVVGHENIQNHLFCNGKVLSNEQAELRTEASGKINYINLQEGKFVKAGTLLLRLNAAEQQTQLEKVDAQLLFATAVEFRRRQLLSTQSISKEEYESTRRELHALKADSAFIQSQIAKKLIYAPFDGVIGIRNVSIGSYITPDVIVANIHQVDPIKIEFSLPERYAPLFKIGDAITFQTEGSGNTYKGTINVLDPVVDQASGNVRYRAWTRNSKGDLLPGSFARVELSLEEQPGTVFLPTEAIVPVAKGKKVFTIKDGVAKEVIVTTGVRTENYLQVLSGIQPGDSVVIKGNFQLKDKAAVKIKRK